MTKKQAVDLAKFRGKFKYSEVKVSECTNGTFQVRNKNIGVNIDDLKDSIEVSGLIQPIGVARSEVTEGSDLYKWEIVWGQRRHYAFESLGLETIPAMVLDEVISPGEGKALSVIENLIRVDMQTKEVWNAIEEIYLTFGSGVKYNVFALDFSYLISTSNIGGTNPLANTMRFTLVFDLGAMGS